MGKTLERIRILDMTHVHREAAGVQSATLDEIVTLVDERLGRNRAVALSR